MVGRVRLLGALVASLLAACDEHGSRPDAQVPDAFPDSPPPPRNDPGESPWSIPYELTIQTPVGPIEAHYLLARVGGGDCAAAYGFSFQATEQEAQAPYVAVAFTLPPYQGVEVTGRLAAQARVARTGTIEATTDAIVVDATRIDYAAGGAPRFTGTIRSEDAAWTLDVALDLNVAPVYCI